MHRADMLLPQSMAVWLMTAYRHDSIMTAFFKYNDHGEKRQKAGHLQSVVVGVSEQLSA